MINQSTNQAIKQPMHYTAYLVRRDVEHMGDLVVGHEAPSEQDDGAVGALDGLLLLNDT